MVMQQDRMAAAGDSFERRGAILSQRYCQLLQIKCGFVSSVSLSYGNCSSSSVVASLSGSFQFPEDPSVMEHCFNTPASLLGIPVSILCENTKSFLCGLKGVRGQG